MALNDLYVSRKSGAAKRRHAWELTKEQFFALCLSPCFYTGRLPATIHKSSAGSFCVVNGVDRRDNNKGYTVDNCVPCCPEVNYAKRILSEKQFMTLVKEVYENSVL